MNKDSTTSRFIPVALNSNLQNGGYRGNHVDPGRDRLRQCRDPGVPWAMVSQKNGRDIRLPGYIRDIH